MNYTVGISAGGGISDIQLMLQVIPSRKQLLFYSYNDAHTPNRLYYPNAGLTPTLLQ